jgi:glutaredoxin 3
MQKNYSVYVKTECPFCKKAVLLLEESGLPFVVIVTDKNEDFLNDIKKQTGHATVPIVLEHSEQGIRLIGGSDNLQQYLMDEKNGK